MWGSHHGTIYSEVDGLIEEKDIQKVDISSQALAELTEALGTTWSGYNPLQYVHSYCDNCGDGEPIHECECVYREDLDLTLCKECYEELKEEE